MLYYWHTTSAEKSHYKNKNKKIIELPQRNGDTIQKIIIQPNKM